MNKIVFCSLFLLSCSNIQATQEVYHSVAGIPLYKEYERRKNGDIHIFPNPPYHKEAFQLSVLAMVTGTLFCFYPVKEIIRPVTMSIGLPMFVAGPLGLLYALKQYRDTQPVLILKRDGIWYEGGFGSDDHYMSWDEVDDVISEEVRYINNGKVYENYYLKVVNNQLQETCLIPHRLSISFDNLLSLMSECLVHKFPEKARRFAGLVK